MYHLSFFAWQHMILKSYKNYSEYKITFTKPSCTTDCTTGCEVYTDLDGPQSASRG